MSEPKSCPSCGKALAEDGPLGLCPECLMRAAFVSGDPAESAADQAAFVPPTAEELRTLFPQLEIFELIGRGGMGAVYRARQPLLDRQVALKILARSGDEDPRFAERFQREAQALAKLAHPNIVTVYDFGQAGSHYYLVMEYVDGLNLRQLERSRRLSPEEALAIVPAICEALEYAHQQGIVHRDIKPENILLDKQGRVKIADFGIAKIVGGESGKPLTAEHQVIGTPYYMAPEQLENPGAVDRRADIYSLGVVFYEMLTGELPLGRFAPPSHRLQIDVRLDEVVLRALEKAPERRYQQVSEIRTHVERIATSAETSEEPALDTKFDLKTWSPFQSPQVRAICAHMTPREKLEASRMGLFWGLWCGLTMFGTMYYIMGGGNAAFALAILALVQVIAVPIWLQMQRRVLCSTQWARNQGLRPENLRLFSQGSDGEAEAGGPRGGAGDLRESPAPRRVAVAVVLAGVLLLLEGMAGFFRLPDGSPALQRIVFMQFGLFEILIGVGLIYHWRAAYVLAALGVCLRFVYYLIADASQLQLAFNFLLILLLAGGAGFFFPRLRRTEKREREGFGRPSWLPYGIALVVIGTLVGAMELGALLVLRNAYNPFWILHPSQQSAPVVGGFPSNTSGTPQTLPAVQSTVAPPSSPPLTSEPRQISRVQQQPGGTTGSESISPKVEVTVEEEWRALLLSLNGKEWRAAFALGQRLAALPPEEGLAILRANWGAVTNVDARQQLLKAFAFADHHRLPAVLELGLLDSSPEVQKWALGYLGDVSVTDFSSDYGAAIFWAARHRDSSSEPAFREGVTQAAERLRSGLSSKETFIQLELLHRSDFLGKFPDAATSAGLETVIAEIVQRGDVELLRPALSVAAKAKFPEEWWKSTAAPLLDESRPQKVRITAAQVLGENRKEWVVDPALKMLTEAVKDGDDQPVIWNLASALAAAEEPRAIPPMIGLMEADPTSETLYAIGHFGVSKLVGIPYAQEQDGAWWRQWWEKNKQRYPTDVQALEIPSFPEIRNDSTRSARRVLRKFF